MLLLNVLQEGIKPMWEDENNKNGGRWLINLDKKQRTTCLDNFWLEVMLCLIGESFEDDSQLVRRQYIACLYSIDIADEVFDVSIDTEINRLAFS
jgi:hypothetical protein